MLRETLQGFARFIMDQNIGYDNFWVSDYMMRGSMIRDICTGEYGGITDTKGNAGYVSYDTMWDFQRSKKVSSCSQLPASIKTDGYFFTFGEIDPEDAITTMMKVIALANSGSYRSYLPVGAKAVKFVPKKAYIDTQQILYEESESEDPYTNVDFKVVRMNIDIVLHMTIDYCKNNLC
jgi:hypothetical protein